MTGSSKEQRRATPAIHPPTGRTEHTLERQLREINKRYELAAKATNDAMYDYNVPKGTVIWNDAIHSHYGHSRSVNTVPIEWWAQQVHPDDALRVEGELKDWLDGDQDTWQSEYRFMRGDGTYAEVRDRGFLQRSPTGEPLQIIGTLLDITEQRRLDRAKDEFMSLVSHQLRTPLTIIRTYSDMFVSGFFGELEPAQLQQAEKIANASARLIELISDMLSLSRIEMGSVKLEPTETDINALIETYISDFLPLTKEKDVAISFKPDTTLPLLSIDATLFGQVIYNLIENAIHYSRPGSTVTIGFSQAEQGYELCVRDTGIGVPVSDQAHIFDRFFRANNAPSANPNGTGLGLYLVKLVIVDTYGGRVWCDSDLGQGTEIHAFIPASNFGNA